VGSAIFGCWDCGKKILFVTWCGFFGREPDTTSLLTNQMCVGSPTAANPIRPDRFVAVGGPPSQGKEDSPWRALTKGRERKDGDRKTSIPRRNSESRLELPFLTTGPRGESISRGLINESLNAPSIGSPRLEGSSREKKRPALLSQGSQGL